MERPSAASSVYQSIPLAEPVGFVLLYIFLKWVVRLQTSSPGFMCLLSSCTKPFVFPERTRHHHEHEQRAPITACMAGEDDKTEDKLSREDVELVLERMRISSAQEEEGRQLKEFMGFGDLSTMFEEKEPSLEELKDAFCVFDENSDGFIDAKELQRVLVRLGFVEGSELKDCERMIAAYDDNGDRTRIDFNEFVKFMEGSFCS